MSRKHFACHYFTPDGDDAADAIKRLAARAEKDGRGSAAAAAVFASLSKRALEKYPHKAAVPLEPFGRLGEFERSTLEFLSGGMELLGRGLEQGPPKLLVIKYPGAVSAFCFEPDSGDNWFGLNTRKNCHPQRHGGLLAMEETDGQRRVELWKNGKEIQSLELDSAGGLAAGDTERFFAAIAGNVGFFRLRKNADAAFCCGDAFAILERSLGFPLLLDAAAGVPAGCIPVEETALLRIFQAPAAGPKN